MNNNAFLHHKHDLPSQHRGRGLTGTIGSAYRAHPAEAAYGVQNLRKRPWSLTEDPHDKALKRRKLGNANPLPPAQDYPQGHFHALKKVVGSDSVTNL